jgi:hypothetical protein
MIADPASSFDAVNERLGSTLIIHAHEFVGIGPAVVSAFECY